MKNCFDGYLTETCNSCIYWSDGTDDKWFGCNIPGPIMECPAFAKMIEEEAKKRKEEQRKHDWKEIFENNGWRVYDNDDICEVGWYSPAGEDFSMMLDKESPISDFVYQAENFDVDEHVEMWIPSRGKNGTPSTIRELLEDAEKIQKELLKMTELINEL